VKPSHSILLACPLLIASMAVSQAAPPEGFVKMPDTVICAISHATQGEGAPTRQASVPLSRGSLNCKSVSGKDARVVSLVDRDGEEYTYLGLLAMRTNGGMVTTQSFGDFYIVGSGAPSVQLYIRTEQLEPLLRFLEAPSPTPDKPAIGAEPAVSSSPPAAPPLPAPSITSPASAQHSTVATQSDRKKDDADNGASQSKQALKLSANSMDPATALDTFRALLQGNFPPLPANFKPLTSIHWQYDGSVDSNGYSISQRNYIVDWTHVSAPDFTYTYYHIENLPQVHVRFSDISEVTLMKESLAPPWLLLFDKTGTQILTLSNLGNSKRILLAIHTLCPDATVDEDSRTFRIHHRRTLWGAPPPEKIQ
jgi:hypothetical protein